MNEAKRPKYEARARIIKAMAHPTRLFILDELSRAGEECVCHLTEKIGADISTVSRHLALLKGAGIIEDEKCGAMVYYRLKMACLLRFLDCVDDVLKCQVQSQRTLLA
jgi:DNA-binding transcriptional ArsR family regulator